MGSGITVVIPAYNVGRYIEQTLESVLRQTLKPDEIIVVDDASLDDTRERVAAYGQAVRLIRCRTNSGGTSIPRNIGIEAARTQLIVPFDSDDLMSPRKLEHHAQTLAITGAPVVFSDYIWLNNPPGVEALPVAHSTRHGYFRRFLLATSAPMIFKLAQPQALAALLHDHYVGASALMYDKQAWQQIGGYSVQVQFCEDLDFILRLGEQFDFGYYDEPLYLYRIHDASKSAKRVSVLNSSIAILRRYQDRCPAEELSAYRMRLAELEFDLSWHCSEANLPREARRHWFRSYRFGFPRRRLCRLALHLALRSVARTATRFRRQPQLSPEVVAPTALECTQTSSK